PAPAARAAVDAASGALAAAPSAALHTHAHNPTATRASAIDIGRKVIEAEAQATRMAAAALVEARRKAVAADGYVRRNPWTSVLLAAAAGLTAAAMARRGTAKR
ncbi:MAG: hypothetical protein QM685_30995, partial [Paraburkholderia sp.]